MKKILFYALLSLWAFFSIGIAVRDQVERTIRELPEILESVTAPAEETPAEDPPSRAIPGDDVPALTEYRPEPEDQQPDAVDIYREDVPLSRELQYHLWSVCQEADIDYHLALGLIECESGFNPDAVSKTGDVGLCQLSKGWHAEGLTPAENITTGIWYLRTLLDRSGNDVEAALTRYRGKDEHTPAYVRAVLSAAEKWRAEG